MDERVIFSHQAVTVGYTHFTVNQKTYPVKDITSVEPRMLKPKRLIPRLFIFGGVPFILAGGMTQIFGLILILTGLLMSKAAKLRFALVVHTFDGEEYQAFVSEDSQDVGNVMSALNVAIAMKAGAI